MSDIEIETLKVYCEYYKERCEMQDIKVRKQSEHIDLLKQLVDELRQQIMLYKTVISSVKNNLS